MRDFLRLFAAATKVAKERHDDPKNMAKGDYPKDKYERWHKVTEEFTEMNEALSGALQGKDTFEHTRDELGDLLLSAAILLEYVESEALKEKELKK